MPLFYYDKELYIYLKWMLVLALLCHITRTLLSEILKVSQSKWAAGSGRWAANLVWQKASAFCTGQVEFLMYSWSYEARASREM